MASRTISFPKKEALTSDLLHMAGTLVVTLAGPGAGTLIVSLAGPGAGNFDWRKSWMQ
jgi:hypothetical protein